MNEESFVAVFDCFREGWFLASQETAHSALSHSKRPFLRNGPAEFVPRFVRLFVGNGPFRKKFL